MAGSSSYPLSTTACRRARVTESLLANNVTSQPRATSPSVMLLATVSQAPYCRGGVRQAIGDRTATLLSGFVMLFDASSLGRIVQYLRNLVRHLLRCLHLGFDWLASQVLLEHSCAQQHCCPSFADTMPNVIPAQAESLRTPGGS